jgi:hypothetical protein
MNRLYLGPVFVWEMRRISRQWWFYGARSVLIAGLLLALGVVWWAQTSRPDSSAVRTMARVGEGFFQAIALAQLAMVLLAAPAATAGAFGTDKARGHVFLMLITELSVPAIVLGTLAARLLPVIGGVVCVLPVLALTVVLGGVPPHALVDLVLVTLGTAVLCCTLALMLSIGSRRTHEVLVATYALLIAWVLGYPILFTIRMTGIGSVIPGSWLRGFLAINPVWIALAPIFRPGSTQSGEVWAFLAGTLAVSALLLGLAVRRLRPATVAGTRAGSPWSTRRLRVSGRSESMLDAHPVFWRECRIQRPTTWVGLLWGFYVAGAVLFSALAAYECSVKGVRATRWAGLFNGFQCAVGLMLLSLVTPASLAEDRARGSLEVLLSTPLPSRNLISGKWLAHYRTVAWMSLLPGVVAVAHAVPTGRWIGVPLVIGTVLAMGAAVTSLGIALATWVPRLDRAVTLSAAASVFITIAWIPLMALLFLGNNRLSLGMAAASPLFGPGVLTSAMGDVGWSTDWSWRVGWALWWIGWYGSIALVLYGATLATFDRCVGRVIPRVGTERESRWHRSGGATIASGHRLDAPPA